MTVGKHNIIVSKNEYAEMKLQISQLERALDILRSSLPDEDQTIYDALLEAGYYEKEE